MIEAFARERGDGSLGERTPGRRCFLHRSKPERDTFNTRHNRFAPKAS
ncbi:hypothetical protein ACWDA3_61755 [Nonomuraea rubra]